ncbi:BRD4-interacting chromatin-remodeling complex-associated protein-like [Narcine bancroftii]|uniref:BRD4-interacting chromatin-remodeling complex-associated protein-like n=1 Tax=Narcine bancroftii TaxID=1343680 RepID=UPI003831A845
MDDEDGRCLLDVICDPQALNDFLHGSNKVTAAASAGVGSQVTPSAACVEISFLDDDVLGSPVEEEPCDILQQSLQEANITLQEEADVAASMLLQSHPQSLPHTQSQPQLQCHPQAHTQPRPQLHPQSCPQTQPCPNSQPRPQPCPLSQSHPYPGKLLAEPASDAASDSQPTFASALVPCPVPSDPVSTRFLGKRLGVQCLIQRASLKTVAASVQAAYNGSPRGSSLSQTQMVDQYIGQTAMISVGPNHHHPITKASLPTNLPPESYPPTSPSEDQVTPSSSVSPFPKDTGLHGTSLFTNAGLSQSAQLVTGRAVVRTPGSSQNVIKHRTPPQIQPKHCVSIQPKVVQISPKASFGPNPQTLEAAIKIQTEAVLQQQKSPPNSTFVAGVSGQNIFLPAQGHSLAQTVARSLSKQQAQPDLGKSMSVHVLKPGSIVIQPPSIPQPVVPGHSQFILPGRLAGTSAVTLPQRPPAVPAEALLTAQSSAAQGQLATSGVLGLRGPSGQLGSRQSLPAHILSTQNLAGHLTSFGRVVAAANTQLAVSHGRARIVSGPLQLPPGQLAPSTQLPVPTQLGAGSAHTYPPGPRATTMVQGISLPNRITVLNHTGPVGQAMNLQQLSTLSSKGSVVQTSTDAELTPALALLQTHTSPQCHPHTPPQSQSHLLDTQHPPPPSVTTPLTVTSITVAENINQQDRRSVLNANQLLLFQQKEQKQQLLYQQALRLQQKKGLSLTSSTSLSLPVTAESVLASGGSGAAAQAKASLVSASTVRMAPNKPTVLPQAQSNHFLPALASQTRLLWVAQCVVMGELCKDSVSTRAREISDNSLKATCCLWLLSSYHQLLSSPAMMCNVLWAPHHFGHLPEFSDLYRVLYQQLLSVKIFIHFSMSGGPGTGARFFLVKCLGLFDYVKEGVAAIVYLQEYKSAGVQRRAHSICIWSHQRGGGHIETVQGSVEIKSLGTQRQLIKFGGEGCGSKSFIRTESVERESRHNETRVEGVGSVPTPWEEHEEELFSFMFGLTLGVAGQVFLGLGREAEMLIPNMLSSLLPSGRRSGSLKSDTSRFKNSFFSTVIRLLNFPRPAAFSGREVDAALSFTLLRDLKQDELAFTSSYDFVKLIWARGLCLECGLIGNASPGMITDLTGLNVALSKGPVQFQMFGRGIACLTSTANIQSALFEEPIGSLKQSVGATLNRADLLLERFCKDQTSVLQPDCNTPFYSFEDTVFRLLPYHVCKGTMPSDVDFNKVDEEFEVMSTKLLKRTQAMLNKYRMLLFEESRRTKPSAEMVMIDRMFIQEEKVAFLEAKQLARESPDAYISSVFQPNITNSSPTPSCLLVAPNELIQNASQISGTNLVMEQARCWPSDTCATASKAGEAEEVAVSSQPSPPKANTASARGELKLKIKQEAGYSKVIHNTALDQLPVDPVTQSSGTKGSSASPFSHSNRVPSPAEKRLLEHLDSRDPSEPRDHLMNCDRQNPHCCSPKLMHGLSRRSLPQDNAVSELEADEKTGLTSFPLNNGAYHLKSNSSIAGSALQNLKQDTVEGQPGENSDDSNLMKELEEVEDAIRQGLTKASYVHDLHWELPLPQPKRHKSDSVDNASFSSDSPQDSTLNQHLQSAINSILDLQRVQMSEEEQSMAEPSEARELSSPLFSPVASSGDYRQPEQDRDFVRAGTSTLEEAVNSILSD